MRVSADRPTPINPNATPEAQALLEFLYEISGQHTLSGQHNTPAQLSEYSDQAAQITGHYPALWGQDFGFHADDMDGIIYRQAVMDEAKRQRAAGSVITLMWHAVRPIEEEPVTFKEGICGEITDDEWQALLTPGTEIHSRWTRQVDVIAGFLTQLRDASIPVLWRPYHEMNGDWFWWGGRGGPDGYAALYRQLYDRLVNTHGLHNLLWVWNANAPAPHILPYSACFPGTEWVDVLATDIYRNDYQPSHYDDLMTLADGKPIALGEVGVMPTPELLDAQPRWAWFMVWTNFLTRENTPEAVRALYASPRVRNRSGA
jgi:mannan endo-1,4-beta-mannosidase